MEVVKKLFNGVLIVITAIAVFMSCLLLYFVTFGKDKVPTSIVSTYATTVTDPQTGEELPTLEANYYSNKNKTGYEVLEFKINSYSGVAKQAIYSRGFQMVWDNEGNLVKYVYSPVESDKDFESDIWYYDSSNNSSFVTGHIYEWGDKMPIDINGQLYAVALDGQYVVTTKGFDLWKSIGNAFVGAFTNWDMFNHEENWYKYTDTTYDYTFEDLMLKIKDVIKSSSNGTGDSVIPLIDLGDFMHIYAYDAENGQFSSTPLGGDTANVLINSYFAMKTHYDNRGMAWFKQSMFNSVAGDSQFNKTGLSDNMEYWKSASVYTLTEKDFVSRYSSVDNGFYYALPNSLISELKTYENVEINIDFNLSNIDLNVLGFDYYALNGIKVKSLTISSKTQKDFRLLVGSLKDTGLTSADIHTSNVNLVNTNSGVEL